MTPTITPEQRTTLDEHNGEPIIVIDPDRQQRFVLIADTDDRVRDLFAEPNGDGEWTAEKEARRRDLIDKDIARTITVEERAELAVLDRQGNQHYDNIAPRPLEGARRLHQQLLDKRGNQCPTPIHVPAKCGVPASWTGRLRRLSVVSSVVARRSSISGTDGLPRRTS